MTTKYQSKPHTSSSKRKPASKLILVIALHLAAASLSGVALHFDLPNSSVTVQIQGSKR